MSTPAEHAKRAATQWARGEYYPRWGDEHGLAFNEGGPRYLYRDATGMLWTRMYPTVSYYSDVTTRNMINSTLNALDLAHHYYYGMNNEGRSRWAVKLRDTGRFKNILIEDRALWIPMGDAPLSRLLAWQIYLSGAQPVGIPPLELYAQAIQAAE